MIRAGTVFQCAPDYFRALSKNGLVELENPDPKPSKNRSIPEAPNRGGKGEPAPESEKSATEQPPDSGAGTTSASLRAGRVSSRKILGTSAAGAKKKGKPKTPAA